MNRTRDESVFAYGEMVALLGVENDRKGGSHWKVQSQIAVNYNSEHQNPVTREPRHYLNSAVLVLLMHEPPTPHPPRPPRHPRPPGSNNVPNSIERLHVLCT